VYPKVPPPQGQKAWLWYDQPPRGTRARPDAGYGLLGQLADLGLVADGCELADAALVDLERGH
jgi:hypothetical protein